MSPDRPAPAPAASSSSSLSARVDGRGRDDPDPVAAAEPSSSLASSSSALDLWAQQISRALDLDLEQTERHFNDSIEDMQVRLGEFDHLLQMTQGDASVCLFRQTPKLAEKFQAMEKTFDKIDRLEFMVARIKKNMDDLDQQLSEAESTVEGSATTTAIKSFMPLFFKQRPQAAAAPHNPGSSASSEAEYRPPTVFSTKEFFPSPKNDAS